MIRFPDLPPRLSALPTNKLGFPVPYFAEWIDGEPDFRVVSSRKMAHAVKHDLCWVCGQRLGTFKAFVIGPMCGINRTISDPPSHRDCATWSAQNCPFLSRPLAKRRADDLPSGSRDAAGLGLKRNPGAVGVWVTKSYRTFRPHAGNNGILFSIGDPVEVTWFSSGRKATTEEVMTSVRTGLPSLYELAHAESQEAVADLDRRVAAFESRLTAEAA